MSSLLSVVEAAERDDVRGRESDRQLTEALQNKPYKPVITKTDQSDRFISEHRQKQELISFFVLCTTKQSFYLHSSYVEPK